MRTFGIPPVTAAQQVQKAHRRAGMQPLPDGQPSPARAPSTVGITDGASVRFFVIGDHGGVKDPEPANRVSNAMQALPAKPSFVYTVGDIVYFNGDESEYPPQFYEQYAHLNAPFVGIPGNHDGDTTDDPSRKPLDTFMSHFCDTEPRVPKGAEEYGRTTQTQPYCDWTLALSGVTIIGLYSNVPSGGHLEQSQIDWLASELAAAPPAAPVIVALHHPPYSVDAHHGGSVHMGQALDSAFEKSKRCADAVLSGHVHNYQRFTREFWGKAIPYVVVGNSGYHNLHKLAAGAAPGTRFDDVVFEAGLDSNYGFLSVEISGGRLSCEAIAASLDGQGRVFDRWSVPLDGHALGVH